MLPFFVLIPLVVAFLTPLISKLSERLAASLGIASGLSLLVLALKAAGTARHGVVVYPVGGWQPPFGICLVLDGMTVLFLIVVNLIGSLALLYSLGYMKKFTSPGLYYTLFGLLLAGLNGIVISGDLFNMFVFLEITSIASYSLVAFGVEDEELEASFKYLVLGSVASTMVLLAIGMILGSVSTLNMADISRAVASGGSRQLVLFSVALFIMGYALKAGLVPFHTWLADAHPSAPAPVSAMLSGVVIKTLGMYQLLRVIFCIFGATPVVLTVLVWLGIVSMSIGVLLAIGQWDFKRLLAYHSVSQIGYVIFGIGLGTPLGIAGGLFHLFNHSLFKSLLFLNAGSVEYATGSRRLDKLNDLRSSMPVTASTSLVASLSIAGLPPLCGFWSKLLIIIAAFQAHHAIGAFTCIAVSIMTLASFLKVQKYAFGMKTEHELAPVSEVPFSMRAAMVILAVLCIAAGIFFVPVLTAIIKPAAEVLLEGTGYARLILGG